MNKYIFIFCFILAGFQSISAQPEPKNTQIDVMVTVVVASGLEKIGLKVSAKDDFETTELTISPFVPESGQFMISGTPYRTINLRIPAEIELENQFGDEATLQDTRLMAGPGEELDSMESVSSSECVELSLSEAGRLYLRLGGTIESEQNPRGTFTGMLSLDC